MKEFKTNLKNYRVDNGYTQELLAKLLNVSRSTVAKWENGLGLPTEESINDICKIFSITRDKLFETENTNELILENYKGILEYEEFFASISTYIGIVNINGFNLNLEKMTNDDIKITGKIESIDIERTEE